MMRSCSRSRHGPLSRTTRGTPLPLAESTAASAGNGDGSDESDGSDGSDGSDNSESGDDNDGGQGQAEGKSAYERMREAKIARNMAVLERLGLLRKRRPAAAASKATPPTASAATTTAAAARSGGNAEHGTRGVRTRSGGDVRTSTARRRSGRLMARQSPPPPSPLRAKRSEGHLHDRDEPRRSRARHRGHGRGHIAGPRSGAATATRRRRSTACNDSERDEADPEWIDDMRRFLLTVPHGTQHKVTSIANANAVMRQVSSLASGRGIAYHRWPENIVFAQDRKISLEDDMSLLLDEAVQYENTYGRDLGNGWLLAHPINKIRLFQDYRRSNLP